MTDINIQHDDTDAIRRAKALRQRRKQKDDADQESEKKRSVRERQMRDSDKRRDASKEKEASVQMSRDNISRYQSAKITERYAYASAAERVAAAAAEMTAGSQDNQKAASVSESLESMVHDTNATFSSMDAFVDDYMEDSRDAAMQMEF